MSVGTFRNRLDRLESVRGSDKLTLANWQASCEALERRAKRDGSDAAFTDLYNHHLRRPGVTTMTLLDAEILMPEGADGIKRAVNCLLSDPTDASALAVLQANGIDWPTP